jgi:hypothetical protein
VSVFPLDRLAELLARFHLGHYADRPSLQARLAFIFASCPSPPGTLDRLLAACDYLGVTGIDATRLVDDAAAHGPEPLQWTAPRNAVIGKE